MLLVAKLELSAQFGVLKNPEQHVTQGCTSALIPEITCRHNHSLCGTVTIVRNYLRLFTSTCGTIQLSSENKVVKGVKQQSPVQRRPIVRESFANIGTTPVLLVDVKTSSKSYRLGEKIFGFLTQKKISVMTLLKILQSQSQI